MPRKQTSLTRFSRETTDSPLAAATRILRAKIIDTDPASGRVAVALNRGGVLRNVPVLQPNGSSRTGHWGLPQVWNSAIAVPPTHGGRIYDEANLTRAHDTFALVGFVNGATGGPVVLGMQQPNAHQLSFDEPNLLIDRTVHDHHTVHWTDNQNDLRPPPFGDGGDDADPYTALLGNWQMIFPDRYQDQPVARKQLQFGDDYQTFISVGYHDTPRQFGDGETSSNYDSDWQPWKLSPNQKGDDPDKGQKYARGLWLNQRWRSRLALDTHGDVELRAEGLDFDSTHFVNKTDSFGAMDLWARLDQRQWSKDFYQWVRMRPRHDGNDPESVITAKQTGSAALRVQRDWDVGVRRQVTHTYVEGFTLEVGDFDTRWNTGPGGIDPGTQWDDSVLNPDFKQKVNQDTIWRGTKDQGYLRGANVAYTFQRPSDSLQDGPLTFTWGVYNKQYPIDGETTSDCDWSLTQTTVQGDCTWMATLQPTQGKATATWVLTGDQNSALYTISVNAVDPHDATLTLTATAKNTVSLTLDAAAGTLAIQAPNGVLVNGSQLTIP